MLGMNKDKGQRTPPVTINTAKTVTGQHLSQWLRQPISGYVPLADVAFGETANPIPPGPPRGPMIFPNAESNKMLNLPSVQAIYDMKRTGGTF